MLGLTQEAAAAVLGMSQLNYQRIETGRRHFRFTETRGDSHRLQLLYRRTCAGRPARQYLHLRGEGAPRRGVGITLRDRVILKEPLAEEATEGRTA